jgi:SAM-dependent methyltransferase
LATIESDSAKDRARLLELIHGYRATCIIVAALDLGVIDALAAAPAPGGELAARLGAQPPSLARLLAGMEALGLVEQRGGAAALTAMGRLLVDPEAGVRERARLAGAEYLPAWQGLARNIATGETAFDRAFGMSAWQHRQRHPELGACLDRTMRDDQLRTRGAVAATHDFSGYRVVVDVGGGEGVLLAELLARWPQLRGVLLDQPQVVAGAAAVLEAAGVAGRSRVVGGSFFDAVPEGGDAYLLQHILHDWDDGQCARILASCRAAMRGAGTLLVVENIVPDDGAVPARLAMLDLHMMVMLGGRERTRAEYESLLRSAGFAPGRWEPTPAGTEILAAVPR